MKWRMRILTLALILCPLPAMADPLQTLEPLLEVFSATHDSPGYDVVGIRCAGLIYAQDSWHQQHGGAGPTKHLLSEAATALDVSTQHRVGLGQDLTTATLSIEADFRRVYDLYLARFATNAKSGHPWSDDPLLKGDQSYCNAALG
jgi:hypothetical protein